MKKKITVFAFCAVLFALCMSAEAQQNKNPADRFPSLAPPLPLPRPATRHSGKVCASLAT